ncbi:MAG TPA: NUDIX domain-containing protein [Arsenophonus sp.]
MPPYCYLLFVTQNQLSSIYLFTRRTDNLRVNANQISFPSGAYKPKNHNLIETTLRESYEEINILPNQVRILSKMQPLKSHSDYLVMPIVGNISYYRNPAAVAVIFEVPLKHALSLAHHHSITMQNTGHNKRLFFIAIMNV